MLPPPPPESKGRRGVGVGGLGGGGGGAGRGGPWPARKRFSARSSGQWRRLRPRTPPAGGAVDPRPGGWPGDAPSNSLAKCDWWWWWWWWWPVGGGGPILNHQRQKKNDPSKLMTIKFIDLIQSETTTKQKKNGPIQRAWRPVRTRRTLTAEGGPRGSWGSTEGGSRGSTYPPNENSLGHRRRLGHRR